MTQSCPSTGAAVSISIAVLTHNETREFKWLMGSLEVAKELIDEIVIVDDYSDVEFLDVVQSFKVDWPIKFFQRRLNKNFAAQRNFAKSQCTGRLIFFPDADEIPSARILVGLPTLLAWMESNDVDVCYLPRLNIVTREEEIRDPLTVTPKDTIFSSWEDQVRILRNLSKLKFVKRIDEGLYGFEGVYRFPQSQDFALLHVKTQSRVSRQNAFYRSFRARRMTKLWNSFAKRTFRIERPRPISFPPPV